ncbi:MAG: hypothetical protein CMF42_06035 [Legionellales bacterium]|nr:hypothetical protein [Legionellales bacterium]OUX66970.1 MAG: hypothetical protein CBD38_04380 [bacterium TMED178]
MENKPLQHVMLIRHSHQIHLYHGHISCWQTINQFQFQLRLTVVIAAWHLIHPTGSILNPLFVKDTH